MAFMTAIATALQPFTAAIGIGSAAISTIGTINAANATEATATYNARIAERDAEVADQNRKAILAQTDADVADKRRENRRMLSTIRAAYGASGLEMSGSPLDVLQDTAIEQELDVARTEYEGRVRAREGALQMLGLSESAKLSRMEASGARKGKFWGAAGTFTSGVGATLSRTA